MFFRHQTIRKIDVLLKSLYVKSYDDSIKISQRTNKFFFFNFKSSRTSSNNSFFSKSFVFKTNRFRSIIFYSIFSNFEFQNDSKTKKRQSLTSFFDIINRDYFVFRVIFVSIIIIESKDFYFNNENQSINQRTKQNINNFNNFDSFTNFNNFINFTFIIMTKN